VFCFLDSFRAERILFLNPLIDLQLLEAIGPDPAAVKDACERVFAARAQQPWPPALEVSRGWAQGYSAMARELDFAIVEVEQAARIVRSYIQQIASA